MQDTLTIQMAGTSVYNIGPGAPVIDTPEIDLSDPQVMHDPFTAYGRVRERSPVARLVAPGFGGMWAVTRHDGTRAMLTDHRFELNADSYLRPDVPEHCVPYMRTMQEMDGPEHTRLRRLVTPAFSAHRTAEFRPRVESIVNGLVDALPDRAENGTVDLLDHFARPLPIDVICELVGIPLDDRPRWREYGAAVAAGQGQRFAQAIPGIIADARAAVASRTADPGDDLLSHLVRTHAEDGDRLTDTELVTLVWHLVLAGQTPTNLIANAVHALLSHPDQLALLRAEPALMPGAVEELTRWCGPQLLTIPRYAREDVDFDGVPIGKGDAVTAALAAANRDPRVFPDPDRLDITRSVAAAGHLGYAHGPHFCFGAPLARLQTEVAITALLRRFHDLALAGDAGRVPDPGTWRLTSLPVASLAL
jgi:cytochrome P450